MSDTDKSPKIELDQVMLAMDVVDTLRHQQSLVERELKSEEYDHELIDKLRRIYASQGIEVTEEVIAQGVKALRADRFTYKPPRGSLQITLARIYVNRWRWAKRGAVLVAALGAGYLLYQVMVVTPAQRGRQKAAQEIVLRIKDQADQVRGAEARLARAQTALQQILKSGIEEKTEAVKRLGSDAARQIQAAQENLDALEQLTIAAKVDDQNVAQIGQTISQRLNQRRELITAAGAYLDQADRGIAAVARLQSLPGKLDELRRSILGAAREDDISRQAAEIYSAAMAAVGQGDAAAAEQGGEALQQLYQKVVEEYQLRIVSRPGVPSGIWRYPEANPNTRNYYLIVEAMGREGKPLVLPITSEENGQTRRVNQWGVRVSDAVFEQVRRDKEDDGIINRNVVGEKKRGYLQPQYFIPLAGGSITEW
ncbi:MAG: hypothetical protein JSW39_09335 [Desulfobacterales bacterium]|nr:MAG: hypothetical protein JSW39_09335 [Desulfobacterales bacterium]